MRVDVDHTVLPANYTMLAFTPQPQSITSLWLVLILPSHRVDLGVTWVCVHDLTWHQNDLKVD